MDKIKCTSCLKVKACEEFTVATRKSNGRASWCRECNNTRRRTRYKMDVEYKQGVEDRVTAWRNTEEGIKSVMIYGAKNRVKGTDIPFNLSIEDFELPTHCPVLGIKLEVNKEEGHSRSSENSPTLDRIIPALGYVKSNVMVISMKANRCKSNLTAEEITRVGKFYDKEYKSPHVCGDCYGVNKGFDVNDEGYRVCHVCEGRALTLQEAADTIANLKMPNTNSPFMGAYDDSDFG